MPSRYAHSWECIKELISGLPKLGSMETLELEQTNEMPSEKYSDRRYSSVFVVRTFICV